MTNKKPDPLAGITSRRDFLKLTGAAVVALTIPAVLRKPGIPGVFYAQRVEYTRESIGRFSELRTGQPIPFRYPWDHPNASNFLIRLNEPAGGGIGPDNNVVAFNSVCPHQGGPLEGRFHDDIGVAGPCPLHWTTFDLTRHGMVVSGHATQGLPQIVLQAEGDEVFAVGVQGLIFGYQDNLVDPTS